MIVLSTPSVILSESRRDLAGSPRSLALARVIARRWSRRFPEHEADIVSAAQWGLCRAALGFSEDKARDGMDGWPAFASYRIQGAIKDALRDLFPYGYRRAVRYGLGDPEGMPDVLPVTMPPHWDAGCGDGPEGEVGGPLAMSCIVDPVSTDRECPVGWEVDSADEVEWHLRGLPNRWARVMRLYYLECEGVTLKRVGKIMGFGEGRALQLVQKSVEKIRSGLG